jgi:excisionase family DNA binding protein
MQAYTVEQVAEILHVGRDKVYYLLRTRQLRSLKIGKLRRITDEQIAAFIASLDDAALLPHPRLQATADHCGLEPRKRLQRRESGGTGGARP